MKCPNTLFCLIVVFIFGEGCQHGRRTESSPSENSYATGFSIYSENGITRMVVRNPWEKAKNIEIEYFLIEKSDTIPARLSGKNIIRTPVERIICLSTTHLSFLDKLEATDCVVGISGAMYVSHPEISRRIKSGEIPDVGYGQNLNYEEIIRRKADVVMVYGVDSEVTGSLSRFRDLGVSALLNAEYLEETPLGKAEWIKFTGALFHKRELADSLFTAMETDYLHGKELVGSVKLRPKVMMGLPYRDAWWVPGGESYMAKLIADAGGEYLGAGNPSHESYVISFEEALLWAAQADIWLNVGTLTSKEQFIATDSRFSRFGVFNRGRIFNNNKRTTDSGGNDFWESGVTAPEVILADLIQIFHPGLFPARELVYYNEIK